MDTIKTNTRRPWNWTSAQLDKLNKVITILEELKDYKPLTLRQIYYQLVGKGYIENNSSQYKMLSGLLKNARLDGHISWCDIADRIRNYNDLSGWDCSANFVKAHIDYFLEGYQRNLLQSQSVYPEIWIEKDSLSSIFTRVASPFCVSVAVCRGFSSVSFLNDYKTRLSYHSNQKPILLYFGDFDPSGMEMLKSMEITLRDELKVTGIEFKRIGLLYEDIEKYNLPNSPEALKKTDSRANKHIAEFGSMAVELDALRLDILEDKIRTAIENEINAELFRLEQEHNTTDLDKISSLKSQIIDFANKAI